MSEDRYLLRDGDDWFAYLGNVSNVQRVRFKRTPVGKSGGWVEAEAAARQGWYRAPVRPTAIETTGRARTEIAEYILAEGIRPSVRFPAKLTPDEWHARVYNEDYEVADERTKANYVAVHRDLEPPVEIIDTPLLELEGTPAPDDGLTWTARLPFELRAHPEFLHLFPGRFAESFIDAFEKRADAMPRVVHTYKPNIHRRGSHVEVGLKVPFDPPQTRPARKGERRGRRKVARLASVKLELQVPARIEGVNRAEAKAEWEGTMARLLAEIEAASVAACGHCDGRGYVERNLPSEPQSGEAA